MSTTSPLILSICIPAYNKPNHLRGVLESIASQAENYKKLFEVLVYDDASPNCNAAEIAKEFSSRLSIRAKRHEKNVGFDANTAAVVGAGEGEFLWILSDNDTLLPGAFDWLFKTLREQPEVDYIYADRIGESEDVPAKEEESICVASADEFILNQDLPGFISSQIFRASLWRGVDSKKYIGTLWVHVGVILEFLPKAKMLRSGRPLIRACGENSWVRGGKNLFTFLSLRDILMGLAQFGYMPSTVKHFDDLGARHLCETAAYAKLYGLSVDSNLRKKINSSFKGHPLVAFFAQCILTLPLWTLKLGAKPFWFLKKLYTTI